jgi:hypothetical protein
MTMTTTTATATGQHIHIPLFLTKAKKVLPVKMVENEFK